MNHGKFPKEHNFALDFSRSHGNVLRESQHNSEDSKSTWGKTVNLVLFNLADTVQRKEFNEMSEQSVSGAVLRSC